MEKFEHVKDIYSEQIGGGAENTVIILDDDTVIVISYDAIGYL